MKKRIEIASEQIFNLSYDDLNESQKEYVEQQLNTGDNL
jgi:hypothetical protein